MKFSRSRIEHFLNQERLVKDTFDEMKIAYIVNYVNRAKAEIK